MAIATSGSISEKDLDLSVSSVCLTPSWSLSSTPVTQSRLMSLCRDSTTADTWADLGTHHDG